MNSQLLKEESEALLKVKLQRFKEEEVQKDVKKATSAVEVTWGSIKFDKDILKYIAEDKEIEYEV